MDAASEISNLAIVLDCSGSMSERTPEGRTKMEAARQAAIKLVQEVPDGVRLAFVIYGHDRAQECDAVRVARPLEPLDQKGKDALVQLIGRLQPVGSTPIALALRTAGRELAQAGAASGLVLISDGKEMCGGNPASEAAALARDLKLGFGVQVVGFGVKPDEKQALEEIAAAGQGKYYDAPTPAALRDVVQMLAKRIEEEVQAAPRAEVASTAKPSADPNQPTPLKLGEVVKGRVDPKSRTNKAHYWLVDLPAGEYKAVVDMERGDRRNLNIIGEVHWLSLDGEDLGRGHFNDIAFRLRHVFPFRLDEPRKGVVRVEAEDMMDYDLGLFESTATVTVPFFRSPPQVTPIKLGQTFAPPNLNGRTAKTCDAYCSLTLPAGDYKVTVELRRVDGKNSNITGEVEALNADGMKTTRIGGVIEIDNRTVKSFKLALSEEQFTIFRVTASSYDQILKATLKVEPLQGE